MDKRKKKRKGRGADFVINPAGVPPKNDVNRAFQIRKRALDECDERQRKRENRDIFD